MITFLNDHCNSIPSSQEPLLNILADRINRSEQNYKRNVTEARARDLVYVHSYLKPLQLQSLDYEEANVDWERWAVSDSDRSEEEQ